MQQTISHVQEGWLYPSERGADPILVGTPAWFDWLEHHTTFRFADGVGGFTAHTSDTDIVSLSKGGKKGGRKREK